MNLKVAREQKVKGHLTIQFLFATMETVKGCLRFAWIITNSSLVILLHLVYMSIISPLSVFGGVKGRVLYWKFEEMFYGWILCILDFTISSIGYNIVESGDGFDDVMGEKIIFMPNHQSVADVLVCLAAFVSRPGYARTVMWIIARKLKYTNFGIMSWLHDDFFLDTDKHNNATALMELKDHLRLRFGCRNRRCLVLFPEGGFLCKKKASSNRFARKNKLPFLQYCAYPRLGALKEILDELVKNISFNKRMTSLKQTHYLVKNNENAEEENPRQLSNTNHLHCNTIGNTPQILETSGQKGVSISVRKDLDKFNNHHIADSFKNKARKRQMVFGTDKMNLHYKRTFKTVIDDTHSNFDGLCFHEPRFRKPLRKIVDVTIAYPNGNPINFLDIMLGRRKGCNIHVHYRVFDVSQVPIQDSTMLRDWMYKLYNEKDVLLASFYREGRFPETQSNKNQASTERRIQHTQWKYYLYNIFYFLSLCIFWNFGKFVYTSVFY